MDILEKVEERLSVFKNFYDDIRIVDPIKKEILNVKDYEIKKTEKTCYSSWKKDAFCENCISAEAYNKNDTFVKIEYHKEKINLITATPIEFDGKKLILEIIKDITKNGSVMYKSNEDSSHIEELISFMDEKVVKDELTGLYNSSYISERLPIDITHSKNSKMPLSIVMLDVDSLGKVNDTYGYDIGDKLLIDLAKLVMNSIRSNSDWVGRLSGEEFIIVLNETELKNAYTVAEKIRKQIENVTFNYGNINMKVTASCGVYRITDHDINISDLISKVSKNLDKAKKSGRNRTIINQMNVNEVKIENIKQKTVYLPQLLEHINETREILNELCYVSDESKSLDERLIISQYLDELIIKYMRERNNLK